jgi:hypothetical protein
MPHRAARISGPASLDLANGAAKTSRPVTIAISALNVVVTRRERQGRHRSTGWQEAMSAAPPEPCLFAPPIRMICVPVAVSIG